MRPRSMPSPLVLAPLVGGGALAGWTICAPQEQASHTYPPSRPPSRSPHRRYSRTEATKAARVSAWGRKIITTPGVPKSPKGQPPEGGSSPSSVASSLQAILNQIDLPA
jgi:hypothetical protein